MLAVKEGHWRLREDVSEIGEYTVPESHFEVSSYSKVLQERLIER